MLGSCWHPWAPGGLERQLEGGQAAPPWVLGQAMQSRAAVRCWRCLRPPPDASLDRRPTRPPLVGGSWHLQPAPEAQKKEAPLMMLFLKNTRNPLGRSCPHTWSMTSEGRSLHLARPDPTQLDQHAARRAWHPAAPRRERMERARVAEDRSVQQAAEDPSSTAWPFTLACTTPWNKVTRSWPPSPTRGSRSAQLKVGQFWACKGVYSSTCRNDI